MCFFFGAGGENRTLIACLEGRHISHYTTPAYLETLYQNMSYNGKHERYEYAAKNTRRAISSFVG